MFRLCLLRARLWHWSMLEPTLLALRILSWYYLLSYLPGRTQMVPIVYILFSFFRPVSLVLRCPAGLNCFLSNSAFFRIMLVLALVLVLPPALVSYMDLVPVLALALVLVLVLALVLLLVLAVALC
eukprot:Rmarinus@m.28620